MFHQYSFGIHYDHECKGGCGAFIEHEFETSYYASHPGDCTADNDIECINCREEKDHA